MFSLYISHTDTQFRESFYGFWDSKLVLDDDKNSNRINVRRVSMSSGISYFLILLCMCNVNENWPFEIVSSLKYLFLTKTISSIVFTLLEKHTIA